MATPNTLDGLPPKSDKAIEHEMTGARRGRKKLGNLRDQVVRGVLWPTPRVKGQENAQTVIKRKGLRVARMHNLTAAVQIEAESEALVVRESLLPTPRVRGLLSGSGSKAMMQRKVDNGEVGLVEAEEMLGVKLIKTTTLHKTPPKQKLTLFASWVEWVMGYDIGWTDLSVKHNPQSLNTTGLDCFFDVDPANVDPSDDGFVPRVAPHSPHRVERLKGLGNAVVPQITEIIGHIILKASEPLTRVPASIKET